MKAIRRMEELPIKTQFRLPNWKQSCNYRATAWAYLNRPDGGTLIESDRETYKLHIIHYKLNQDDMRQKTGRSGSFKDQALCGSGSYHEEKAKNGVTCPACLEMMRQGKHRAF